MMPFNQTVKVRLGAVTNQWAGQLEVFQSESGANDMFTLKETE